MKDSITSQTSLFWCWKQMKTTKNSPRIIIINQIDLISWICNFFLEFLTHNNGRL
jgi:hypothetical protein